VQRIPTGTVTPPIRSSSVSATTLTVEPSAGMC
jgi:hypothetical protein